MELEFDSVIDIKGIDKAEILKSLYDSAKVQGMGFLQSVNAPVMTITHAEEIVTQKKEVHIDNLYFDYVYGRILKVDISKDEFSPYLYDRDNGAGSAMRAIDALRLELNLVDS